MTIHDNPGAAGGAAAAGGDDLPSLQFRHFAAVLTQAAAAAVALGETDARAGAEALSRQLAQLIELQTLEAGRRGGKAGFEAELQGRFLKAALADEVLLHTDWAGRGHWRHVLLEANLFNSAHAGQQVFADIDQLLREREPARRGVARLYLYLLSLGFQGRYRDGAGLARIADYRRELFQFIYQRAADLGGREAVVAEQAYASTLSQGGGRRLPKLSRRGVALALAMLLLLGLSEIAWLWQSWPVRQAVGASLASALIAPSGVTPC
ncbi:type VI secretion system protein ImpK [Janthinobacterium sp. CG_23.3]|uniref:DotU family type IV/VI secretion system protein n=1 Tax=Janthinobacterium sp. CG_23.3 TaxID=3349634 RepID=UPI0038D44C53